MRRLIDAAGPFVDGGVLECTHRVLQALQTRPTAPVGHRGIAK